MGIQKGMNPFAAGMSMFVSLLSAMTIIGLPVEGTGPQTVLLDRSLVTLVLSIKTEYHSLERIHVWQLFILETSWWISWFIRNMLCFSPKSL